MPKVLVAGEKVFFVHSFTQEQLENTPITQSINDATAFIGQILDNDQVDPQKLDALKPAVIMLLKQSETYKRSQAITEKQGELMDGYVLLVYRGKNDKAKKTYIATWAGQSSAKMIEQNPAALIPQVIKGFKQFINVKDYHKKSALLEILSKQ